MPRAPNEKIEKAKELYLDGVKLVEIASQLEIPPGTVRRWKSTHNWDSERSDKKANVRNNSIAEKSKRKNKSSDIESVVENPDLTDKQRAFCLYYLKNFNATLAAIKAGYSSETASQIGYQLLQKTSVRKEIKTLKELKRQAIMVDESDIVERYMNIAFADMTDFIEFSCEEVPVIGDDGIIEIFDEKSGKMIPLTQPINRLLFKNSNEVDGGLICEISQGKNGTKLKLEDRQKALDWLARYFLMNPLDKHRIEFDNKKFELEKSKINGEGEEIEDLTEMDDLIYGDK